MIETNTNILPPIPTGEELEARVPDLLKDDNWFDVDVSNDWLDPAESYERPKWTLSFKGVPFAPLGGIHALTGQPGHGKTMTFTQLMVAILRGEYGDLRYELGDEIPEPKVLYIDTEMEKGNTQLVMLRIYSLMGWEFGQPHDRLRILRLRETDKAEDRWRKTLKAIWEVRPTVCFIDGLLDVVEDFNKNDQCQQLIYNCMKVASWYGISVWCLVHENPGTTKMVGHLGSILERKVTDAFATVKKKDVSVSFSVKQKKARGKDMPDWNFEVIDGANNWGEPRQLDAPSDAPEPEEDKTVTVEYLTAEELQPIAMMITSHDGVTTRDMLSAVKEHFKVGVGKAEKILAKAIEFGIIARGENKRYYLPDQTSTEQSVPF